MSSTSLDSTYTMKCWKKKTNATFGIDEKGLVLVVLLQILGGDGSLLWLLFGSLFGVSSVHSCPMCSVWDTNVSDISNIPIWIECRSGLPVPIYSLLCTSPRSSQFWVANHDILGLVEIGREFLGNFFWYISSARCGPHSILSVLQFCSAEHHEVAPFWWRSAGLREHPVATC